MQTKGEPPFLAVFLYHKGANYEASPPWLGASPVLVSYRSSFTIKRTEFTTSCKLDERLPVTYCLDNKGRTFCEERPGRGDWSFVTQLHGGHFDLWTMIDRIPLYMVKVFPILSVFGYQKDYKES